MPPIKLYDQGKLNEEALRKLQNSETPHLAVEALRRLIERRCAR